MMRLFLLFFCISVISAQASVRSTYDANSRCNRIQNPFTLNGSNVNSLIALSCSALSHVENEQKNMQYEDSATLFHQWQTRSTASGFNVSGHCSLPYSSLNEDNIEKYKINLNFLLIESDRVQITGSIAGKHLDLVISNNKFLDMSCSNYDQTITRLERINLGIGFGMKYLTDMLSSGRTGTSLSVLQHENWIQGQNSMTSFSGIGLQYRMSQLNGRQLVFAVAESPSTAELHIRSVNYLEYAEDTNFPKLKLDNFYRPTGFAAPDLPVNHKFQSYPIQSGSQIIGCSSLIYDGELDRPQNVDLEVCKQKLDSSSIKHLQGRRFESKYTPEELEAIRTKNSNAALLKQVQAYLKSKYGPVKNYSRVPSVYETGRAHWTKEDIQRGYVIFDRTFQIMETKIHVKESRYNIKGAEHQVSYLVPIPFI